MVTARIMMMTISEDDDDEEEDDNFAGHHSLRSYNCKSMSLRSLCELHFPIIIQSSIKSSSNHHPTTIQLFMNIIFII